MEEVCSGLQFPEGGPIPLSDGSVLVVEIQRATLTRVYPNGTTSVVCTLGGGPNSSAIGPDGNIYITNNGGFNFTTLTTSLGVKLTLPHGIPPEYKCGSIQQVDTSTGEVRTLYEAGTSDFASGKVGLRGPNDLVFDSTGGFYFTDHGKDGARQRDKTGVWYANTSGTYCHEIIFPMDGPNGCGLSPDEKVLYVATTVTGKLFAFDITSPGVVKKKKRLLFGWGDTYQFDSLAVDADGNICVATLGAGQKGAGGISVISPDGAGLLRFIPTGDALTTNISFYNTTAFITLGGTGKLMKMNWPCKGKIVNYEHLLKDKPLLEDAAKI